MITARNAYDISNILDSLNAYNGPGGFERNSETGEYVFNSERGDTENIVALYVAVQGLLAFQKKIQAIKLVRDCTSCLLKEAKDAVEATDILAALKGLGRHVMNPAQFGYRT